MVNISHKTSSLRKAIAEAVVMVSDSNTIYAIQNNLVPKGNVFEFSRAAGLLAVKKTSDVIPDCHPLPIEYTAITHNIEELKIIITVEVHTIYKTGVEVEAMHGAAITALTMYDMLKPIDAGITISTVRLIDKQGGKSDFKNDLKTTLLCAVVVCSDSVSTGTKHDKAGKAVMEVLENNSLQTQHYAIIPDEIEAIQQKFLDLCHQGFNLVLFTGGTGLSARDVTPEAISPLITRPVPGIMEAARQYGQQRTPYAMLSRGIAGFRSNTLVITLPGSTRGARETMHSLFPYILHVFKVANGMRHDANE